MTSRSLFVALCTAGAALLGACASQQGAGAAPAAVEDPTPVESTALARASANVSGDVPPDPRNAGAQAVTRPGTWQFMFDTYVWLLDMDGTVGKDGHDVPVSTHLGDSINLITDHFDLALAGHLEARNGDWTIFLDVNYASFSGDGSASRSVLDGLGTVSADMSIDMEQAFTEFGGTWRAGEFAVGGDRKAPVELLGGARWNHLAIEMDLETTGAGPRGRFERKYDADFSTDWVDPFVGARTLVPLSDKVGLLLRGDIGGGFGSGSNFAWNLVTGLVIRVSDRVESFVGYRWYSFERDIAGRNADLQIEGPGVGLTILF